MPHTISRIQKSRTYNYVSPFGAAASTHSDVVIKALPLVHITLSPRSAPSPSHALSPKNAPSPMTVAVRDNVKLDRAFLFVHGRHMELLTGMSPEEKIPGFDRNSLGSSANVQHNTQDHEDAYTPKPTPLCRWSIHVPDIDCERIPSPPPPVMEEADAENEETWRPWAQEVISITEFAEALQNNLKYNSFSNIEVKDLPISSAQVAKAAKRSPEKMTEEAFGFSIMARNTELICNALESDNNVSRFATSGLYPLHLAATYLDGGKTCCNVFNALVAGMPSGEASVRKLYMNHLDHTVLDTLMIAILKAHTSCLPRVVDDALKKEPRFAGEEVDICGRWDADSKCIRALHASGIPTIPFEWKHMFCHTSVQTICHCIWELFGRHWRPNINTPSGIYTKRCSNEACGLKLQLMPLHTLVVTAVHLASGGSPGETMC